MHREGIHARLEGGDETYRNFLKSSTNAADSDDGIEVGKLKEEG
jgi:hypothetical protein